MILGFVSKGTYWGRGKTDFEGLDCAEEPPVCSHFGEEDGKLKMLNSRWRWSGGVSGTGNGGADKDDKWILCDSLTTVSATATLNLT